MTRLLRNTDSEMKGLARACSSLDELLSKAAKLGFSEREIEQLRDLYGTLDLRELK